MHKLIWAVIALSAAWPALAAEPVPEIERAPLPPQAVGAEHALRNIIEACVQLRGRFDEAGGYVLTTAPRSPCRPRARYLEAVTLPAPPSVEAGWILNDVLRVPRADCPEQATEVRVWRRVGTATPPALDAQGRSRLYVDSARTAGPAVFTATVAGGGTCPSPL